MNFQDFYKATHKLVYLYFYYRVSDKSVIDDLTQDVYIDFFRKNKRTDYSGEEIIKILFGYCRTCYKAFIRDSMKSTNNTYEFLDNYNYEQDSFEYAVKDNQNDQKMLIILDVIKQLNKKVRKVIEYRFIYGLERKQVAGLLDMKERDVLKYQQRGIKYIQKRIREKWLERVHNPS